MSNRKIKSHRNIYITKSNGFIYAITILYYALENLLRGYVAFFHRINNQSKQKSKGHKEDLKLMGMITYYIDFGDSFTDSCICPTSDCIYSVKFFEHQLYLNKIFKKKNTLSFYIINLKSICGLIQAMDPDI